MSKFTFVYAEDWSGVYVDDELLLQGHSLDPEQFLQTCIEKNLTFDDVDRFNVYGEWLENDGYLPYTLQEFMEKNNQ